MLRVQIVSSVELIIKLFLAEMPTDFTPIHIHSNEMHNVAALIVY